MPSPLVVVTGLSGVAAGVLAGLIWRRRDAPGAVPLAGALLAGAFWAGLYALSLTVFDPQLRRMFTVLVTVAGFSTGVGYVLFTIQYTGHGNLLSRWTTALIVHPPVLAAGAVATNHLHGLAFTGYQLAPILGAATVMWSPMPILVWTYAFSYVTTGIGSYLILRAGFSGQGRLYRTQALGITAWAGLIGLANTKYFLRLGPLAHYDATPLVTSVVGAVLWYAIYDDVLFKQIPAAQHIGRETAIEALTEAVFVLDDDGCIVDLNPAGMSLLDASRGDLLGNPLSSVLDVERPAVAETGRPVVLDTPKGRRTFDVVTSTVTDASNRELGRTVVFHDVTDRQRRKERLQVFNRVLRHNLRNKLTTARLCVGMLGDDEPPESPSELVRRADRSLGRLAELSEKAQEINHITNREGSRGEPSTVEQIVRNVVERVQTDYPAARIEGVVEDGGEVVVDGQVLAAVVGNLVENAVEHNDREEPTVTVRVSVTEREGRTWGVIAVADDGPGIPAQEREAVLAGRETPLEHGSGLGLWLAKWGVSELGGRLEFGTNEPRGSVVTVRVPTTRPEGSSPT